jgi:general secretion pathway protein A
MHSIKAFSTLASRRLRCCEWFAPAQISAWVLVVALPIASSHAAMYTQFFRLTQAPFSISPNPRYLFMSERHREALAHLLYGIDSGGGVVLLSGDIGTGKTTICRCFLEQVPANCNVAYIFNPKLTATELLQSICEEFHVDLPRGAGVKDYIDALNRYLLAAHADGRSNVLVIDEAQNLAADVLEQLRLLTNLETNERKLLQIILIGQPELRTILARPELEQLAQRVIAHYHLTALSEQETASYIQHRLATAGLRAVSPFQPHLMKQIYRLTLGVPRRINLLCDRALLGAYAKNVYEIEPDIIDNAAAELFFNRTADSAAMRRRGTYAALALVAGAIAVGTTAWALSDGMLMKAISEKWPASVAATGESLKQALHMVPAGSSDAPSTLSPAAPSSANLAADELASTRPILSDTERVSKVALSSEKEAIHQLSQLWGESLDGDNPCEKAKLSTLRCHRSNGGLSELRRLDRPAVLKLYGGENKTFYALLTGLNDASATLRSGDVMQPVSLVQLTRQFQGEFITLWRAPGGFDDTVELNDRGSEVDWIMAQLAKLNGVEPPAAGQPFNQQAVKQVRQFQRAHGLFVDGVAGPATVMHINRFAGVAEPRLRDIATSGE